MKKVFDTMNRRLRLMVARAVVTVVSDALKTQNLQVSLLADEAADDVERFQNYGHTSVPPAGSEAIVLSVGGMRQQLVAVVVDSKATRLNNLESGDSALYHMEGHHLVLTKDGVAKLICKRLEVVAEEGLFDIPETQFTGNVTILGNSTTEGQSKTTGTSEAADHISDGKSGKSHTHREHDGPQTGIPQ